ncbi:transcriptional regulator [Sorangium cellulosum]|uniref:Transcriptional regulator n=1 Tax=Sorangium cellulosum TaxID=56 RepID=A0A4P2Q8A1_SORCE|nr:helix-turn-helix transcriptional regulator [Sorangium cellulosum]AUX25709.1 transcriptional regulator [Sorangium cellulosum]
MGDDALPREVGRAIRVLRLLHGLSYAEFAEKARLSATYLRQVERGERDLGLGALGLIAQGLNCDARLLLPGDGRSPVSAVVADRFDRAPEALQEAILFLLIEPEGSPKKQAILALINEDPERSRLRSRPRPDERAARAGAPASSGRRPGR